MKVNAVGPLVVAAAAMHLASAATCTSLTQNILTSVACPTSCAGNACVLYSPSQTEGCTTRNASAAGACYTDSTFTPAGDAGPCDLTYQCLVSLTDSASSPKWYLALTANSAMNKVTTAPVTEISQLKYPPNGKVSIVQLAGGLGKNARGNIKNVILDDSFFLTPDSVHSFYLSEINLEQFLDKVDFATRTWTSVSMNNANLHAVPAGFAKLALTYVELKKNFITNISDASLFTKVTELHLEYNDITNITAVLPAVETLNLTGNPLTKIPDAIFQMKTLKALSLLECNISNPQVTAEQFTFLEQLQKFEATPAITECASGYGPKNLTNGRTVCLQGSPSAADLASGGKKSSNHTVVIVVAIIGGVVVVSLVAFLVLRRRKSTSDHYSTFNKDPTTTNGTDFTEGSDTYGSSSIWNDPDLLAVRIEFRDIEPIKLLSRGGFGEVWLGLYMNENVAIKRLLADKKTMNDALAFASEIKTMARLDHPKIVRFIGVAWTNALTIQAVTEFMDCGDLRSLLDSSRASSLTWANLKCQIAIDVADALVYLHTLNPKLIHRDLKSRNVLIDANSGAKLSDFGISRNRSVEETMTAGVGTARWIAPEVILGGHYTEFADIYSFGVVLSELDTNKAPFHDATNTNGAKMQDVTILQLVSAGKLQPSFTNTCPEPIIRLAKACMSFDPAQRPSAIHISYELRKILKDEL